MYGKFFASTFTGSMVGSGCNVFAVWGYCIANGIGGQVELNPRIMAAVLGASEDEIRSAIEVLCSPDPHSRSGDQDGRRLVQEGAFAYRIVNFEKYRSIRNEEERREYNRRKQAEHRAKAKVSNQVSLTVNDCQHLSAHTETEAEAETEAEGSSGIGKPNERKSSSTLCRAEARPQSAFGGVLIAETPADSTPTVKTPRKAISDAARAILEHLNNAASRAFEPVEANLRPIQNRLTEVDGDIEGIKAMITRQCALWKTDDRMSPYLRPATLFQRSKFHGYYADRNLPVRNGQSRPAGPSADRNARIGGADAWEAQAAARIARMEAHCPWDPREPSPQGQTGG